ncbi:MAG: GTPase Era [Candidatus Brocadiae bacterium]|nr:GTPase Era [Candidatus Brocadiia bacterium]
MPEPTRCGYVSIVGKPNVGKSTLLNAFAGRKVSIVSEKPGTTRHRIHAAITRGQAQALFTDTPGLFKPRRTLDRFMEQMVLRSVEGVDLLLLVADEGGPRDMDRQVLSALRSRSAGVPVLLVLNRMDLCSRGAEVTKLAETWRPLYSFRGVIPVSAKTGKGLPLLWEAIAAALPEAPFEVGADEEMAPDNRRWASDLIREKVLHLAHQEVPHSVAVVVSGFEEEPKMYRIAADLIVERDSQKPILIGAGGSMIRAIGTAAREDLESQLGKKVFLELFVKVRAGWRDDPSRLAEYGYED